MDRFVEHLRNEILRTGRVEGGKWVGSYVGVKLPTECNRCADSFFAESVLTQHWYWLEQTEAKASEYVCEHCLTPQEKSEMNQVDLYTLVLSDDE